jgi:uncharacterized membrane protein YfcA
MLMLSLLFLTGLLAGTVDAIAGGGGLITMPVLMSLGIPPHVAFGTNKLQCTFGTFSAARRYWREGWIAASDIYVGIISGLLGATAGAVVNQLVSGAVLQKIVPVMLLIIFAYTVFSPRLGHVDVKPRMRHGLFYAVFGFALAFYDGFFGPGVGAFWVFLLMFFLGYNLIKATAHTKVFNFNSNVISLICFIVGSNIDYKIGFTMAAGQLIGGQLGASLAINKGVKLIRPLFLAMMFLTISTLAYRNYGASVLEWMAYQHHKAIYLPVLAMFVLLAVGLLVKRLRHTNTDVVA